MKKRAIIYTRVSTDDQVDRGYSLPYQEERLRKYCEFQNIVIVAHYREDHSAKTFDRPEFTKLLSYCKKNRGEVDLLLFINWSRFSRNTEHTYSMISQLRKLEVEPLAVDQPLDLSVPENKMMLAFYITAPEVENDRRSLNVLMGLYRAKKEGRWTTIAPVGYKNERDTSGKAVIVPSEDADLIRKAFETYATGAFEMEVLRKELVRKGLKCSRARFPELLRNTVYIGKVLVPAYKDEPAYYTKAVHEPLITDKLFYSVQDILEGRSPKRPGKNTLKDQLPLRGLLECRLCGKVLSGSASKGNGGKYFYYHCTCGCPERFRAEETNVNFTNFLKQFKPHAKAAEIVYQNLSEKIKADRSIVTAELREIETESARNKKRIENAQYLMLDGELSAREYKEIKLKCEEANEALSRRRANLSSIEDDHIVHLSFAKKLLPNLDIVYEKADLKGKQLIIGSVFPEKLIYEKNQFRTKRVNEVVSYFLLRNKELGYKKSGREDFFSPSSTQVGVAGFEPTTSWSQTKRDTGLRYTPRWYLSFIEAQRYTFYCYLNQLNPK
jgi:site-specific DNA recombinase